MLRSCKKVVKRLLRLSTSPWATGPRLARELEALGVREGATLLVHISLSRLGYVPGGPRTLIASLRDAVGPGGTLLMPAHSWEQVNAGLHRFDVTRTASCVGVVPEVFRKQAGVLRSLHPTHSVAAAGPGARDLIKDHESAATPCGEGTPYARLLEDERGQILFLGAGLESNTCYHCLEALCQFPWLLNPELTDFEIITSDGRSLRRTLALHQEGIARAYPETEDYLIGEGAALPGIVGGARSLLLDARRFAAVAGTRLRREPEWLLAGKTVPA